MATVMSHPLPPALSPSVIHSALIYPGKSVARQGDTWFFMGIQGRVHVVILLRNSLMCDWEFLRLLRGRWRSDYLICESFAAYFSHWEQQTGMRSVQSFHSGDMFSRM